MSNGNFDFLQHHDELLVRLAKTAEACFIPDPNTTLVKMRQLGEALAKTIAARVGIEIDPKINQIDLLRQLDYDLRLDKEVKNAFHTLRKLGNSATHDMSYSSHRDALKSLMIGHALSGWFHTQFSQDKTFKLKAYIKPENPSEKLLALEEALSKLKAEQKNTQDRLVNEEKLRAFETEKALAEKQRAEKMAEESQIWESLASEQEAKIEEYRAKMEEANIFYMHSFHKQTQQQQAQQIQRLEKSTIELNESETRVLIDEQLIEAGWQADSENLRYSKGGRPTPNANKAIAEWPTESGPADYVLFMGLTPVAVIEAKRSLKSVYSSIDQAKRYAKGIQEKSSFTIEATYGEFKVPLTFATNGRPYLKQLEEESGIWFLDIRDNSNRRRALQGWYSPQEIKTYLRQTPQQANQELDEMSFDYHLTLRDYQIKAIKAVEAQIKADKNHALIAMATGTGKTKTAIAMVYRFLKSERYRRILFLVDRSALGVQASDDFGEVRLENLNTFADTFEVMGMQQNKAPEPIPNDSTKVHVATVQGLVKRILYPGDKDNKPGVGQYDCIIVDECHRGYLLDRELSDTEILFRDQRDYQSKYRSVIEYFDAFKIGLTATPALHTTDIFGDPVFTYSYPEAVLDGYLNDHQPPVRIQTELSEQGIKYGINEEVKVYKVEDSSIEVYNTPDELKFDITDFNRKVIAPEFTRAVCQWLIESDSINPYSEAKTLVFCVNDKHADRVVKALKNAIENYHGEVDDDAVQKITGASDKPLEKIRLYKNDRLPNIAVTVDLLTTGVDVPQICNLVFLRRVNSRILYEQMLGRATRLCPEIGKGPFKIFDAVDIYKQLEDINTMKPVVTKVNINFTQLEKEIIESDTPDLQDLARKQFIAKLQTKKHYLTEQQSEHFEVIAKQSPNNLAKALNTMSLHKVVQWFSEHPGLGDILDTKVTGGGSRQPVVLYEGDDTITQITTGYGEGQEPQDYLNAFNDFIKANSNRMVALQTVINKPWELTRQSLKELAMELDHNHFREQDLQTAWHEVKQEDIAARIIGFIRQAALGEALIPWEQRVQQALDTILASQTWKTPQKQWLELIAKQVIANVVVDESTLNQGIFKDQGGVQRANKLFAQPITQVLAKFNQALWVESP